VWTIVYPGPGGGKRQKATKCRGPEEEGKAKRILAEFIRRREAAVVLEGSDDDTGPMTFARWAKVWLETRRVKKISTIKDYEQRLRDYVLPHIGAKRLDAVTEVDVMAVLAGAGKLAPRTQRHVFYTMNPIFKLAVRRGLLDKNPCGRIPEEDMPRKKDAVPGWRRQALFTREEVMLLLTSSVVPYDRQVFYSVLFLGGCRFGEVSALRLNHYQPDMQPLAQLAIELSYDSDKGVVGETKTENPRLLPVHPWLKQIIDAWLATGWQRLMGRPPQQDDILVPNRLGRHRSKSTMWQALNGRPARAAREATETRKARAARAAVPGDLERLGLRNRRQHDARRTFISLCRADGARKDILRLCTHGPEGDIMDIYSEIPWEALCAEVVKLRLGPPPSPTLVVSNPAKSRPSGLPLGCHAEIPLSSTTSYAVTPPGIETAGGDGIAEKSEDGAGQVAPIRHDDQPVALTAGASDGSGEPMATLATLALRQALDALDRGRLDEARGILERALAAERDEGKAATRRRPR
jgi:integrase